MNLKSLLSFNDEFSMLVGQPIRPEKKEPEPFKVLPTCWENVQKSDLQKNAANKKVETSSEEYKIGDYLRSFCAGEEVCG